MTEQEKELCKRISELVHQINDTPLAIELQIIAILGYPKYANNANEQGNRLLWDYAKDRQKELIEQLKLAYHELIKLTNQEASK